MEQDFDFMSANADASSTFNQGAGKIREGGYVMLKGRPCKAQVIHKISNGKHGKSKCCFTGTDIFTGAKKEEIIESHANAEVPFVTKSELTCMSLEDGFLSCLDLETYETRQDLRVPDTISPAPAGAKELSDRIRALLKAERDFAVVVLRACGTERVVDVKLAATGKTSGK